MIDITPGAVAQILEMMKQQGKEGSSLRVGVKESGCSGLEYVMDFAASPNPEDQVTQFDGLQVLLDPKSAPYLEEIQLDWGQGLLSSGFKFSNPNATKACGCGKSFMVDEVDEAKKPEPVETK